ncbi:MAG: hypothetical protein HQ591_09420 [candidate division Zixibacteria bacterium]|nr:hypothetical protein [Candidatus Tariuqbacter arcticus]
MRTFDILLTLIAEISDIGSFPNDHEKIHRTFYELSKNPHFKKYFSEVLFSNELGYLFSDEIDSVINIFHLSGILGRPNPTYRENSINITLDDVKNDPITKSIYDEKYFRKFAANFKRMIQS